MKRLQKASKKASKGLQKAFRGRESGLALLEDDLFAHAHRLEPHGHRDGVQDGDRHGPGRSRKGLET